MRVTLSAGGIFSELLPAGSDDDTTVMELPAGATALDAMRKLGLPEGESCLVVLNGIALPKAERATRALAEDDELAIMPPLKGG